MEKKMLSNLKITIIIPTAADRLTAAFKEIKDMLRLDSPSRHVGFAWYKAADKAPPAPPPHPVAVKLAEMSIMPADWYHREIVRIADLLETDDLDLAAEELLRRAFPFLSEPVNLDLLDADLLADLEHG